MSMKSALTRGRVMSWHQIGDGVRAVVLTTDEVPMAEYVSVVSDGYVTREDVEMLWWFRSNTYRMHDGSVDDIGLEVAGDQLTNLANRLEALLPTEEK